MSAKVFFCDICAVLLVGAALISAIPENQSTNFQHAISKVAVGKVNETDARPRGNCSCGGFPTSDPENGSEPLIAQSPGLVVTCDQEGQTTCTNLCLALATATKAKGPEILCNRLKDCNELKLSAFYKTCDNPWKYANMTAEHSLCCEKSKVKPCASATALPAYETPAPSPMPTPPPTEVDIKMQTE